MQIVIDATGSLSISKLKRFLHREFILNRKIKTLKVKLKKINGYEIIYHANRGN